MYIVYMALVARVLESFTDKFLEAAAGIIEYDTSFVGTCLCPECGKLLEVRDVNGNHHGSKTRI